MFKRLNSLTKAPLFYLITFTLAVLLAIWGEGLGPSIMVVTMFTPMVAVLLMLLVVTRDGYTRTGWQALGLHRLGWQRWGLAVLGPLLVLSCTYAIVWSTGIGRLQWAALGETVALGGLISLLLNLIIDMILALGEESGWRGYLLPHLLPLGRTRALLLSGFVHGLWHLPVMLLTPFYHESGNRLLVAALFVLSTTCGGVFFGYLRLKSASVWPAVLAHGVFNRLWGIFTAITVAASSPVLLEYLAGESGVITLIGIALMAGWLLYRWQQAPPTAQAADILASKSLA